MSEVSTLGKLLSECRLALKRAQIVDPAQEARILVGGLTGFDRTALLTHENDILPKDIVCRVHEALERRLSGMPVHRVLGHREFFGLDFLLSPATLEPRPDTEVLVENVLGLVSGRKNAKLEILDLGTGTGAILVSLLAHLPNASGLAVDLSVEALETASANAARHGLKSRFSTACGSWFAPVSGLFDVIVSNPPYIASEIIPVLDREVREHDPLLALDGGKDGLDAYRSIAASARNHLAPQGILALETGYDQRLAVTGLFEKSGYRLIRAVQDYGGNDRVLVFAA